MLHLYAALAEKERRLIADRTKAALAAKKASGAKLDHVFRGLTIEYRVRYRQATGHGLERLLESLRLQAHEKRHQITEQANELLNV
jgi:DNA invertase Pin-like site-specific DNA recombinase